MDSLNNRNEELKILGGLNLAASEGDSHKIAFKQIVSYDENGEIIAASVKRNDFKQNGVGFVISYTEKMSEFICKTTTGATVRLFLYLAHHQSYGVDGMYGLRCTHKFLGQVLNLSRSVLWESFKYLKDNFLVIETRINGVTEFMVNPNYVTIGKDKRDRMREWNERWAKHWKNGGK